MENGGVGHCCRVADGCLGIGGVACFLLVMTACGRSPDASTVSDSSAGKAVSVQAVQTGHRDIARTITLPATLRADYEVVLFSKVTGYVKSIPKDRGDRLKAGELIATLEVPELVQDLESARATFALEDATYRRLGEIRKIEKTAVTDQDLDLARSKRAVAEASVKRLEALQAYTEIRAPFDGSITERFVDPGALVEVEKGRIVAMVDASKVRVLVDVPEPEVHGVAAGNRATMQLKALPGKTFPIRVSRMAGALDVPTRTMRIELDAPNPDGILLPGLYASVTLELERHPDAMVVPGTAVAVEQGRTFVFTNVGGKARRVPVTVGIRDGEQVEITSGLSGNEAILLPGRHALTEGTPVVCTEKNE